MLSQPWSQDGASTCTQANRNELIKYLVCSVNSCHHAFRYTTRWSKQHGTVHNELRKDEHCNITKEGNQHDMYDELQTRGKKTIILPQNKLPESHNVHSLHHVYKQSLWYWHQPKYCTTDVYWTVHHCDNWRIKNQLDATYYFIVLLISSTCFWHYYAHH